MDLFTVIPQELVSTIFSYFSPPELAGLGLVNKYFKSTSSQDVTWRFAYLRDLEEEAGTSISSSKIRLPSTWNWKESLRKRFRLTKRRRISHIFMLKDGDFVGEIRFFTKCDKAFLLPDRFMIYEKALFKLDEDERIVRVDCRVGSVLHSVTMYTNKDRQFRCGGNGGTLMTFHGECLIGPSVTSQVWNIHRVVKSFIPQFYRDPILDYTSPKKVCSITVGYQQYIKYLSFTLSDGNVIESGAVDNYTVVEVIDLAEDEYISGISLQTETLLVSIKLKSNKQCYGPFGRYIAAQAKDEAGANLIGVVLTSVTVRQQHFIKHVVPLWSSIAYLR